MPYIKQAATKQVQSRSDNRTKQGKDVPIVCVSADYPLADGRTNDSVTEEVSARQARPVVGKTRQDRASSKTG